MRPLGPPYTQKKIFFNERILINGRGRLSKHAPRHLPHRLFFPIALDFAENEPIWYLSSGYYFQEENPKRQSLRCILGLALQGPSQTTEIDANRSAVFRNGFKKNKQKHNRVFSLVFAHQNSRVSRASNPRLRLVSDF